MTLLGNLIQLGHQRQTTLQYNDPTHKHAATHRNGSSTPSYTYDANGNMTSRTEGNTSYTELYDAENRLVSVMAGSHPCCDEVFARCGRSPDRATGDNNGFEEETDSRAVSHWRFSH